MLPQGYWAVLATRKGHKPDVSVRFLDLPNIVTWGKDWDDAAAMAEDALTGCLEVEVEEGIEPAAASPKPATKRGQRVVFVPVAAHIRSAWMLRELRGQAGLSREEMAARLGLAPRLLERLENAEHQAPPLDILDRAARLVGRELVLSTVVLVG